jgi:ribosomal protein L35AE/L33A
MEMDGAHEVRRWARKTGEVRVKFRRDLPGEDVGGAIGADLRAGTC